MAEDVRGNIPSSTVMLLTDGIGPSGMVVLPGKGTELKVAKSSILARVSARLSGYPSQDGACWISPRKYTENMP